MNDSKRLEEVHKRAMERFDEVYGAEQTERTACNEDRRFAFVTGAQWEGNIYDQFASRPRMEINKVRKAVRDAIADYRDSPVTVDFRPADHDDDEEISEVLDGLFRADEQRSHAEEAYDNAFAEGVSGGIGAWRLHTVYEDEEDDENDHQRIAISPIYDADISVFFWGSNRYDKADAKAAFYIHSIGRLQYEDEYGKECPSSFEQVENGQRYDWTTADAVKLVEYYEVEEYTKVYQVWRNELTTEEQKLYNPDEQQVADMEASGYSLARKKRCKHKRVHKYLLDGMRVIEDQGYIVGPNIPIVVFYAERNVVDGVERVQGKVRDAKDPQRLYNMEVSTLAEVATKGTISKPIFAPEQIEGLETEWQLDSTQNYAFLRAHPLLDGQGNVVANGPAAYTKPPEVPPALVALLGLANGDVAEILGQNNNADQIRSNVSAEAVEMTQKRVDMNNFVYMDNYNKSVRRSGEIWLGMASEIYADEEREMRGVSKDGTEFPITLMQPYNDGESGEARNDISKGKYKVITDVGPSFRSKRDAQVRALLNLVPMVQDPETSMMMMFMAVQDMDGEGLDDLKKWCRSKLVQAGAIEPNEEEKAALDNAAKQQQPSAQDQFLLASAKKQEADAAAKMAGLEKTQADTDLAKAKTVEIVSALTAQERAFLMSALQSSIAPTMQ